jgi:23S rRNA pseudouridine1911/1915/1917 synthase
MRYEVTTPIKALDAIRHLFPDSSRRTLQHWLKAGRFQVDGNPLHTENQLLESGQILSAGAATRAQLVPGLKILYQDRYLIAIEKPEGLLSVALDSNEYKRNALALLRTHLNTDQIFAVHRIDRETSGCLVFARGSLSEEKLKALFEKHDLKREYFAIVEGTLSSDSGTWKSRLLELENYDVVETDSKDGKLATTHYTVLHRSPKYTYLKLTLETGRKHQIRVHCQAAGHPVLGDERYGSSEDPIRRLCLHAWRLELIHPFTGKLLCIHSAIPREFQKLGGHRF